MISEESTVSVRNECPADYIAREVDCHRDTILQPSVFRIQVSKVKWEFGTCSQ